jgi:hypothetical protein
VANEDIASRGSADQAAGIRPIRLVADKSADSLYDEGRRARERGAALFNMPIDLRSDLVFHVLVRVTTDDGLTGLGAIGLGSRAMADAVERLLAPLVLGRNPFDVELL